MSFGRPACFFAFALLPLLAALYLRGELRRGAALRQFVAARLQSTLAGGVSLFKRRLRFALLLAGLACVFVALAQPRLGYQIQQQKTVGRDVLIAIDVSRSMLANDLAPSRLARAKLAAEDLLGRLHGDRVGLIAFAGSAFLQAPLTIDYSAVRQSLQELDSSTIPLGGTDIAEAIRTAADAFGKGEGDQHALILITDGEELDEDAVAAAKKAAESMRIFTVGVGSPEGTVIAIPGANGQTEYVKSPDGQIVKSALDETRLRAIAEAANGFYVHLESGPAEMEEIVRQGLNPMSMTEADTQVTRRPIERYRWPLAAGLILLASSVIPGERRRARPALTASLLLLLALPAPAKNPGVEAYERKDFPGALNSFEEQAQKRPDSALLQFDAGTAAFKSGDLEKALDAFSKSLAIADPALRERAEYNLGNTLFERGALQQEKPAKLKDWKNSLQHFDQALKSDPKDGDAKYNRDLVAKMVAELEQEQKKEEQQKKEDEQKEKKDQKDQQQKQQKQQNKKDQQPKGGGKDQKDQKDQQSGDGKGEQGQSGQPKDSKDGKDPKDGKDSKDGKDGKDQSGQQAKKDQSKGQQGKDQQPSQDGQGDQQDRQPPEPAPGQQDRKLSGQISDAPQREQGDAEKQAEQAREQQAIEEAQAAAEGKMTPAQAAALLDSLKSADDRVRLLEPSTERRDRRPVRDW